MQLVKLVGAVVLVVTVYPIIPLASSVAFIVMVFVFAVALVITGFVLSILSIFPEVLPPSCPVLSISLAYTVPFSVYV